jgi:hypothetical protein
MDPVADQLAQRGMDHALPLDPALAGKSRAFDHQREVAFAGRVVAAMPAMLLAIIDQLEPCRCKRRAEQAAHLDRDGAGGGLAHWPYIEAMASKASKWHGRVERGADRCAVRGCQAPGEFRAPLSPPDFDGPCTYQYLCLDHVRAHNAAYNYFAGMSPEEIEAAQSPIAGWERRVRAFAANGDPAPAWADFADPLDAIAARFRPKPAPARPGRFTPREQAALAQLGLGDDADRHALRRAYSSLVRRFHPDKNGGDRRHEARLGQVIEAYQLLRQSRAFAA